MPVCVGMAKTPAAMQPARQNDQRLALRMRSSPMVLCTFVHAHEKYPLATPNADHRSTSAKAGSEKPPAASASTTQGSNSCTAKKAACARLELTNLSRLLR